MRGIVCQERVLRPHRFETRGECIGVISPGLADTSYIDYAIIGEDTSFSHGLHELSDVGDSGGCHPEPGNAKTWRLGNPWHVDLYQVLNWL